MDQITRDITPGTGLPWSQLIVFMVAAGAAICGLVAGLGALFQPDRALALAWLAVVCMASWVMFAQARRV